MDDDTVVRLDVNVPAHFTEATYICEVPAGARMIAVGLRIMVVAPDMPPSWLTPTGLVPINMVDGLAK